MDIVTSVTALRERLQREPNNVFVPTMGNLHEGHIDLIRIAKPKAACTVVSIFVNRLQFGPKEDFERYPRTFQTDCDKLRSAGAFRPGHFRGVATVVLKLFNMVMPHAAIFGKKDYQQYLVLRDMVRQFALPVEIIPAETVRAADGLALSSRNGYLIPAERAEAPRLYALLRDAREKIAQAERNFQRIELEAMALLAQNGWTPQYVSVRRRAEQKVPTVQDRELVLLAAAYLGKTRLIDNIEATL